MRDAACKMRWAPNLVGEGLYVEMGRCDERSDKAQRNSQSSEV
jgi:hypothetical protein